MTTNTVEDRLRCHCAVREASEVTSLEVFGDGVVETPESATLELIVTGVAELLHSTVNLAGRECLSIHQVDDEVSSTVTVDLRLLVGLNPLAHIVPVGGDASNRITKDARNVHHDIDGVSASELNVRREAKVVADRHFVANADGCCEGLVMCVTKTKDDLTV